MKMISSLLAALTIVTGLAAEIDHEREEAIKDKMIRDLDIIKNSFAIKYAPAEWKKTYCDWDLEKQIALSQAKIRETKAITLKDFHRIVQDFFGSTRDYHVGIFFYSTEAAFLPFRVHGTQGKYYIAWKVPEFFTHSDTPLEVGDEILLFDGRPVDDAIRKIKMNAWEDPSSLTNQALAEQRLTFRLGALGHDVPKGSASITVRHAGTHAITTYDLLWIYQPEEIDPLDPLPVFSKSRMLPGSAGDSFNTQIHCQSLLFYREMGTDPIDKNFHGQSPLFLREMGTPVYKNYQLWSVKRDEAIHKILSKSELMPSFQKGKQDNFMGSRTSFLPELGPIVWNSSKRNPFQAYIFRGPKRAKIGFVRIPHYYGGEDCVKEFAKIIRVMERRTRALVVDQTNNPGGFLYYLFALASMLSEKPLALPKHRITLTQEDISSAVEAQRHLEEVSDDPSAVASLGETIFGYPVTYELVQSILAFYQTIIEEWKSGRTLTHFISLDGLNSIAPHPKVKYKKPILFLVNQLDFSAGDFMPAILQDNQRARLMGTRTAGAGGYSLSHAYPNLFGIGCYTFTGSIAQRVNRDPIENLGVIPDHIVEMTENDLEGGKYADFVSEIHRQIRHLLESPL
ncbi:MAG: protease-like activity factor CPAF [Waddliaceae bacterium]